MRQVGTGGAVAAPYDGPLYNDPVEQARSMEFTRQDIATRKDEIRIEREYLRQRPPDWDPIERAMFLKKTSAPTALPELERLGMDILDQEDWGGASSRLYGDVMDPYYRNADGTIDGEKLANDHFILDIEDAFYNNRGRLPLDFLVEHKADLRLLSENSEAALALYQYSLVAQADSAALKVEETDFNNFALSVQTALNIGRQEAIEQMPFFSQAFVTAQQEAEAMSTEDFIEDIGRRSPDRATAAGATADPQQAFLLARGTEVYEELGGVGSYEKIVAGVIDDPGSFKMEGVGVVFGYAMDALAEFIWPGSYAYKHAGVDDPRALQSMAILQSIPGVDNLSAFQKKEEMAEESRRRMGELTTDGARLASMMPDAQTFVESLQIEAPDEWETFMAAAGGDEQIARVFAEKMYADLPDVQAIEAAKLELEAKKIEVNIRQLEQGGFTYGDYLGEVFAVYGGAIVEGTITANTAATYILDVNKDISSIGSRQFWQEAADYDSPSDVFGLKGTAWGMMIDFIEPIAFDPFTYIFAPPLARAARQGVRTAREAAAIADNAATTYLIDDLTAIGQSQSRGAAAFQAVIDDVAVYGLDSRLRTAIGGFSRPIATKAKSFLEKWGRQVDDVKTSLLNDLVPESFMDDLASGTTSPAHKAVQAVKDRFKATGIDEPVQVRWNPAIGKAEITNPEVYQALLEMGYDGPPLSILVDDTFGVVQGPVNIAAARQTLAPAGTMTVDDLFKLREVDVRASISVTKGTGPERVAKLKKSIIEDGYHPSPDDPPIEVWIEPNTSEIFVADGNHRITALSELDMGSTPITVKISKMTDPEALAMNATKVEDLGPYTKFFDRQYRTDLFSEIPDPAAASVDWTLASADDLLGVGDDLFIRPRRLFGDDRFVRPPDKEAVREVLRESMLMGADYPAGRSTAAAYRMGSGIRNFALDSNNLVAEKIKEWFTQINLQANFSHAGPTARRDIHQMGARLWSAVDDVESWEIWIDRLEHIYGKQSLVDQQVRNLADEIGTLEVRRQGAQGFVGEVGEEAAEKLGVPSMIDDVSNPQYAAMRTNQIQASKALQVIDDDIATKTDELAELSGQMNNYTEINNVLTEMMDDFTQRHIITHPDFKELSHLTTREVWETITGRSKNEAETLAEVAKRASDEGITLLEAAEKQTGYIPSSLQKTIEILDGKIDVNQFMEDAMHILNTPMSWTAPATPIEMMLAALGGKKAVGGTIAAITNDTVAEGLRVAHNLWMLDKVMTPRTGIVVSLDELVRIFHMGGAETVFQFLEDKAMGGAMKVIQAKKNAASWNALPGRWQNRFIELQEMPVNYKHLARSWTELGGYGYDTIKYKKNGFNREYYEAANRTSSQIVTDRGWQAFFSGKDDFLKWFDTAPEAQKLKNADFWDAVLGERRTGTGAAEAFETYEQILKTWVLKDIPVKHQAQALKMYRDAAATMAKKGSTAGGTVALPEWVLRGFGEITGNRSRAGMLGRVTNSASNVLFGDPMQYRRGFLASWVRKVETARLDRLYRSQGVHIIPEAELRLMIKERFPHLTDDMLNSQLENVARDLFRSQRVISQRTVNHIIETKVVREMEDALYSFQMGSASSRRTKWAVPFGKPWADMWAHWGRQALSRPQLRGWINDVNFAGLGDKANKFVDHLPFNPRTAGFVSRVAATDFDLDRIDETPGIGPLFGAMGFQGADLGGALFLPSAEENAMRTMIPGLGLVPSMGAIGAFEAMAPDPIEDPRAYELMKEQFADYFPGVGFSRDFSIEELGRQAIGGGFTARMADYYHQADLATGEVDVANDPLKGGWESRSETNLYIKAMFQDEEMMQELAELPPELVGVGIESYIDEKIQAFTNEGAQAAGRAGLVESVSEFMFPIRANLESGHDDLDDVWISAVDWLGLEVPAHYNTSTEDKKREMAAWVKSQFFDMDGDLRNATVAAHGGLAVNLVSTWGWTDLAQSRSIPGSTTVYRSDGSTQGLARHRVYKDQGYLKPISGNELAMVVIGTQLASKTMTAKRLYEIAAEQVNDYRWENELSELQRAAYEEMAVDFATNSSLPTMSGQELWYRGTDLQRIIDKNLYGTDAAFSVSSVAPQPWGMTLPTSVDGLREELEAEQGIGVLEVTDKMATMAAAIGIDIKPNMLMADLVAAANGVISNSTLENPLYAYVGPTYQSYLSERSASYTATMTTLNNVFRDESFHPEAEYEYRKNLVFIDDVSETRRDGDIVWVEKRGEAVDSWGRMFQDDALRMLDPKQLWDDAYGQSLGPFDWVPDEPLPVDHADAQKVFVRRVVDGDTLDVTDGFGLTGAGDYYRVRLLGWNQAEMNTEEGKAARDTMNQMVMDAIEQGKAITIVPDADRYGDIDMYGRRFAWLYIGDEPVYDPLTMTPRREF